MLHSQDKNSGKVLFSINIFLPILLLEHLSFNLHMRYFYFESCCRQQKEAVISQLDPRKCSRYCPQVQCDIHDTLHSSWRHVWSATFRSRASPTQTEEAPAKSPAWQRGWRFCLLPLAKWGLKRTGLSLGVNRRVGNKVTVYVTFRDLSVYRSNPATGLPGMLMVFSISPPLS